MPLPAHTVEDLAGKRLDCFPGRCFAVPESPAPPAWGIYPCHRPKGVRAIRLRGRTWLCQPAVACFCPASNASSNLTSTDSTMANCPGVSRPSICATPRASFPPPVPNRRTSLERCKAWQMFFSVSSDTPTTPRPMAETLFGSSPTRPASASCVRPAHSRERCMRAPASILSVLLSRQHHPIRLVYEKMALTKRIDGFVVFVLKYGGLPRHHSTLSANMDVSCSKTSNGKRIGCA